MSVLGIDIGGTSVKFGVVDDNGEIIKKEVHDTVPWEDQDGFCSHFLDSIDDFLIANPDIRRIGIGFPGLLSLDRRNVVLLPNIPNMEDIAFLDLAEERFPGVTVAIDNDAKCAALGEYIFGSTKDHPTFLMITLGTGVGSGLVIDGKIFKGGRGNPNEMGHILVNTGDTLENEIGLNHIIDYAKEQLSNYPDSQLHNVNITPKDIGDCARNGDELSIHIYNRLGQLLGEALISALRFLDVNVIVLGGGVSNSSDLFLPELMKMLEKHLPDYYTDNLIIKEASLHNDAGILGAASLVMNN